MTGDYFTTGLANLVQTARSSFPFDGKKADHTGTKASFPLVKYRKLSIGKAHVRVLKVNMIGASIEWRQTAIRHSGAVADFQT